MKKFLAILSLMFITIYSFSQNNVEVFFFPTPICSFQSSNPAPNNLSVNQDYTFSLYIPWTIPYQLESCGIQSGMYDSYLYVESASVTQGSGVITYVGTPYSVNGGVLGYKVLKYKPTVSGYHEITMHCKGLISSITVREFDYVRIYFYIGTTDVNTEVSLSDVIFPNPFIDNINIPVSNYLNKEIPIRIINSTGQIVYYENHFINNDNVNIPLNLSKGIYFVTLDNKETYTITK